MVVGKALQEGEVVGTGTLSKKRCRTDGESIEDRPASGPGEHGQGAMAEEGVVELSSEGEYHFNEGRQPQWTPREPQE